MSWRIEKTKAGQDYVWDGVENGIAPSPTKGIANMQNVNIATESGQIMASYDRTNQAQRAIEDGTMVPDGATLLDVTASQTLKAGTWIKVTASTISSITAATDPATVSMDYLLVGGGGGGGGALYGAGSERAGGGGGAGELVSTSANFSVGSYTITVGNGGSGGFGGSTNQSGEDGKDSVIETIDTAVGGGGGGGSTTTTVGRDGGSGGGGGGDTAAGGTGTAGFDGGDGTAAGGIAGGGGGGSSEVGENAAFPNAGDGGDGTSSSITGTATVYAGGGGGGSTATAGSAGTGGAGSGGDNAAGGNADANTGSGGGGASTTGSSTIDRDGGNGGSGIAVIRYLTGSAVATGGQVTQIGAYTVHIFLESGIFVVHDINPGGLYYVSYQNGNQVKLSTKFDPTGANAITHGTTGSLTFDTTVTVGQGVTKTTEKYTTATTTEFRYYIIDNNGYLWVFDTYINRTYGTQWMLPDPFDYSSLKMTGLGVLNGMLLAVGIKQIYGKPTSNLGNTFIPMANSFLNEPFPTHKNSAIVGNQGKLYYCDGNYIGEVFATTSLVTSIANIQSNSKYTADSTTGTISEIISGSLPYDPGGTRIPVVFYTDVYGTLPTAINANEVYYIEYNPDSETFTVHNSLVSVTTLDIDTGASGNQYFTTFWPYGIEAGNGGTTPLVQFTSQRLNLPANEVSQSLVEIGNTVIIGGITNTLYPWDQVNATPGDFITLPESNVKTMINVNNIAYIFAGNKGNIYVTNGAVASLALKVPDYVAGVPGTPLTYIEPVYSWGDSDYVRGRVYFSILDQTATKSGNCGGVWSFIPAQNIDPSQDIGMALRLENQNSYGSYNGVANIIITSQTQDVTSPQYWASWQSSYSVGTSTFGIDFTGTTPVTQWIAETDMLPTGTYLDKQTFQQIEYKLSTPLAVGDSLQLYYRLNATDAWTSCGTIIEETDNRISGYFKANFQKTQWTQVRIVATTPGTTASSFVRLTELRLR